jgi:hypothetical protein
MRAIFVACEHEQVHCAGGRDHLMLDAPGARVERCLAPEGGLGFCEQLARALFGDGVKRIGGRPARAAEQGVAGGAGDGFGIGRPDVQEGDVGAGGQESCCRGHGGLPGFFHDPDEGAHHNPIFRVRASRRTRA